MRPGGRAPLLALALLALVMGLWAGLRRLGWSFIQPHPALFMVHGPLMISGFLGTVIGLERAVALGRRWTYAGPLLSGVGTLALVFDPLGRTGALLATAGSALLVAVNAVLCRRQPAVHTFTMSLGALAWLAGNGLWLAGWPLYGLVLWWAAFPVLTVAGERRELSRIIRLPDWARAWFAFAVVFLLLGGALVAGAFTTPARLSGATADLFRLGGRVAGGALLALALWLLRHDLARYTVRQPGLTRFIAVCLLGGYLWLGIGGVLLLALGGVAAGMAYDALLHAVFVGFVLPMIFGHAPIIFPAILRRPMAFHPAFYGHLLLLHAGLLARVAGDLADWLTGRLWGGLLNVVAVLWFLGSTLWAVWRAAGAARS